MSPRKNRTCEICKYEFSTPQKLSQHYESKKTPCRPRTISEPVPEQIQNNVLPGNFLDLDIEVPWPVCYPINVKHQEVWQKGIQMAKDMFQVDGAEYAFSTWFAHI